MNKLIITPIICFCLFINAFGQKPDKKFAKQLFAKTLTYLKTSDTADFIKLWVIDDKPYPYHNRPFSIADVKAIYGQLKTWLDTALNKNLSITDMDIEKMDSPEDKGMGLYKLKVWIDYNKHYSKGFGFNMDFVDNKWVCRFGVDTSMLTRN